MLQMYFEFKLGNIILSQQGVPLSQSDAAEVSALQRPSNTGPADVGNDDEFAYNPENRPDDYPVAEHDVAGGNSFGGGDDGFGGEFRFV